MILMSVHEIDQEAPILTKWKYINGFTLYVMLDQRKKIRPFDSTELKTKEDFVDMWSSMSPEERHQFCRRAQAMRQAMGSRIMKPLVHPKAIVLQQPDSDMISLLGPQMVNRDVSFHFTLHTRLTLVGLVHVRKLHGSHGVRITKQHQIRAATTAVDGRPSFCTKNTKAR